MPVTLARIPVIFPEVSDTVDENIGWRYNDLVAAAGAPNGCWLACRLHVGCRQHRHVGYRGADGVGSFEDGSKEGGPYEVGALEVGSIEVGVAPMRLAPWRLAL
jgi:hypothetical protein